MYALVQATCMLCHLTDARECQSLQNAGSLSQHSHNFVTSAAAAAAAAFDGFNAFILQPPSQTDCCTCRTCLADLGYIQLPVTATIMSVSGSHHPRPPVCPQFSKPHISYPKPQWTNTTGKEPVNSQGNDLNAACLQLPSLPRSRRRPMPSPTQTQWEQRTRMGATWPTEL